MLIFYDASSVSFATVFAGARGNISGYVDVSGYLLDCTAAPCDAIQP